MKSERVHSPYRSYFQGNPSPVIFRSLLASEIPRGFGNSQSCDTHFSHMVSPSGFTRVFILHKNIHATRVVTLFADGLDTISTNKLRGITLGNKCFEYSAWSTHVYIQRRSGLSNCSSLLYTVHTVGLSRDSYINTVHSTRGMSLSFPEFHWCRSHMPDNPTGYLFED